MTLQSDIDLIRNTVWPEEVGKALFRVCDAAESNTQPEPIINEKQRKLVTDFLDARFRGETVYYGHPLEIINRMLTCMAQPVPMEVIEVKYPEVGMAIIDGYTKSANDSELEVSLSVYKELTKKFIISERTSGKDAPDKALKDVLDKIIDLIVAHKMSHITMCDSSYWCGEFIKLGDEAIGLLNQKTAHRREG